MGLAILGKEERSKMRQSAQNTLGGEHLLDGTEIAAIFAICDCDAHRGPQKSQRFPRHEKPMLHCDLRVQWKVASDFRFRAATSEPKPLLSAGFLAIWLCQRGNHQRLRLCDFGVLR